jgi:hypothetical protein
MAEAQELAPGTYLEFSGDNEDELMVTIVPRSGHGVPLQEFVVALQSATNILRARVPSKHPDPWKVVYQEVLDNGTVQVRALREWSKTNGIES